MTGTAKGAIVDSRIFAALSALAAAIAAGTAVIVVVVLLMCDGERFESVLLKYGYHGEDAVLYTEKFVVVYDGAAPAGGEPTSGGGATYVTWKGRWGSLPSPVAGRCLGFGTSDNRITEFHAYEPSGMGILYVFDRLILIEESGRFIRLGAARFPLGEGQVVLRVSRAGVARLLPEGEARQVVAALDPWFSDGEMSAQMPEFGMDTQP